MGNQPNKMAASSHPSYRKPSFTRARLSEPKGPKMYQRQKYARHRGRTVAVSNPVSAEYPRPLKTGIPKRDPCRIEFTLRGCKRSMEAGILQRCPKNGQRRNENTPIARHVSSFSICWNGKPPGSHQRLGSTRPRSQIPRGQTRAKRQRDSSPTGALFSQNVPLPSQRLDKEAPNEGGVAPQTARPAGQANRGEIVFQTGQPFFTGLGAAPEGSLEADAKATLGQIDRRMSQKDMKCRERICHFARERRDTWHDRRLG